MADVPLFQRSPRLRTEAARGEVEIPAPPASPAEPSLTLAAALWPLLPGLLAAVVIYFMARASGANSGIYLAMSLPMMAAGYLVQLGHYYFQKRKYQSDVQKREEHFRSLLGSHRSRLQRALEEQQRVLRAADPTAADCAGITERRDGRLWERSPSDSDFLSLRVGLGVQPFSLTIKSPGPAIPALEPDVLLQEAQALAAEYRQVHGVPVCLPLLEAGPVGIVGPRQAALGLMRAMLVQAATHHAPDEVQVAAIFPAAEAQDWAWLRWLPHVWTEERKRRLLAAGSEAAEELCAHLQDLLNRRKQLAAVRQGGAGDGPPSPRLVLVVGDLRLVEQEPVLAMLLREGPALGASMLILAGSREELPKECRAVVELGPGGGQIISAGGGRIQFVPDDTPDRAAEQLSRAMAPIRLQQPAVPSEIPSRLTLLDLLGVDNLEQLDLLTRWQESRPDRSLAAPVGIGAGEKATLLDLHERGHGPHGLVAGATGSGKSELLQTLVASLAAGFHPHDVAFVMVDYKGGGMANAFKGLPHLIGTITNLEEAGLDRRALAAIRAELKRRQRLLGEAGVNHIDAYIRLRRQEARLDPLPHLIVVVDEFAELKAERPDFMRELVSAVRVGRSLGVHLILATQKPAGVVDEQIWSNARFRLCLRVERPEDSREVIGCPDAASLTAAGRTYFQVGSNERFELFQAGWGGAPYTPDSRQDQDAQAVCEVELGGRRVPLGAAPGLDAGTAGPAPPSQLRALVEHIRRAAEQAGLAQLEGPWLPPLPREISLDELLPADEGWEGQVWRPAAGWLNPVVGLGDAPEHQRQDPLRLPLGQEGHLAVYGAPGTGKSTFLHTLAVSLVCTYSPADLHLYLVDGSGRGFSQLAGFPHVGEAIAGDETERVLRLLRMLHAEMELRKQLLGGAGVLTLAALRSSGRELPAIVLMVDNFPTFMAAYPDQEEDVAELAREGAAAGIHLVVAAGSPTAVRFRVSSNISLAVALSLVDRSDYAVALGRTGGLEPSAATPGRALAKGNPPTEFQAALPARGATERDRGTRLKTRMMTMDQAWSGPRPAPVRVLPEIVPLSEVSGAALTLDCPAAPALARPSLAVAMGLDVQSLEPFAPDLREAPVCIVAGPSGTGKTTLLQSWLLALALRNSPEQLGLWLVDFGGGGLAPLRGLPHVRHMAEDAESLQAAFDTLGAELQKRRQHLTEARRFAETVVPTGDVAVPALLLAVDSLDLFLEAAPADLQSQLETWIRRERGTGLHVITAGPSAAFGQYGGLVKALKEPQTGFVLGSSDHEDLSLLNLRIPAGTGSRLVQPGWGYFGRRGRWREVKAATAQLDAGGLPGWVERVARRSEART